MVIQMNQEKIKKSTEKMLQKDPAILLNEFYERMDRYFETINYLKYGYENNILPKYPRGCTNTFYDMILDGITSMINALKVSTKINHDDIDAFERFIIERRDPNHPERFYIRMYKEYFQCND